MELSKETLLELLPGARIDTKKKNILSDCPFCGKSEHFGILLEESHRYHCFKCGERGNIFSLLKFLNRLDLLGQRTVDFKQPLQKKVLIKQNVEIDLSVPICKPPFSFKRIYDDDYLNSRGWTKKDYEYFTVGVTSLFYKLKEYVTFIVINDGEPKGYLSRCKQSKEWLKENDKLRYCNSPGVDFSKLLYNYDNITEETKTVIIVEGVTGVQNITKLLDLYEQHKLVVSASFGKKLSQEQILKLQQKKIETILLFWDNDALEESKQYSLELQRYFDVKVGFFIEKDSGEINEEELQLIFENLQSPFNFTVTKLLKKQLV